MAIRAPDGANKWCPLGYYKGKSNLAWKLNNWPLGVLQWKIETDVEGQATSFAGQEGGQMKKNKQGTAFSWFSSSDEKWMAWLPAGKRLLYSSLVSLSLNYRCDLCHIVRSKDQLVEDQTWIEIGLKRILKDRIFVPLSFCTACECKQTNPSPFLQQKNPNSKIWP